MITDSVTKYLIRNTNCVVCGIAFTKERASKLYCSSKCRQSGYYHKDKIAIIRNSMANGINKKILIFSIKEFKKYVAFREKIKYYKYLESLNKKAEIGTEQLDLLYSDKN